MNQNIEEMVKAIQRFTDESKRVTITNAEKSLINKSNKTGYILEDEESTDLITALDKQDTNKTKLRWKYGERCSRYCKLILEEETDKPFNADYLLKAGQMDYSKETIIKESDKKELIENVQDTLTSWDKKESYRFINPVIALALTKRNAKGKKVLNKTERKLFTLYFKMNRSFTYLKKNGYSKNPSRDIQRIANKLHNIPSSLLYEENAMVPVTPDMVYCSVGEDGFVGKFIDETPSEVKAIDKTNYTLSPSHPTDRPYEYRISPLSTPYCTRSINQPTQIPLTTRRMLDLRYAWAQPIVREESTILDSFSMKSENEGIHFTKQMKRQSLATRIYSKAMQSGDYRRLAYWRDLKRAIAQAESFERVRVNG